MEKQGNSLSPDGLPADTPVEDFTEVIQKIYNGQLFAGALPIITILDSPLDHPGKFVARLFATNVPTHYAAFASSLAEIRTTIPGQMVNMGRSPEDDPHIVEVWI